MKRKLLEILVCPKSKFPLIWDEDAQELLCHESKLAYPVREGIPILLVEEARTMREDELRVS